MTVDELLELLRAATEDDVEAALEGVLFDVPPKTPVELLGFFNRVLDVLGVPDADGDVCGPPEE